MSTILEQEVEHEWNHLTPEMTSETNAIITGRILTFNDALT